MAQTSRYHYIRFACSPASDALTIRKYIQDALVQVFGLTAASTQLDILWISDAGDSLILRLRPADATKVMAAAAISSSSPHLSVIKDSPFLPALLSFDVI